MIRNALDLCTCCTRQQSRCAPFEQKGTAEYEYGENFVAKT